MGKINMNSCGDTFGWPDPILKSRFCPNPRTSTTSEERLIRVEDRPVLVVLDQAQRV